MAHTLEVPTVPSSACHWFPAGPELSHLHGSPGAMRHHGHIRGHPAGGQAGGGIWMTLDPRTPVSPAGPPPARVPSPSPCHTPTAFPPQVQEKPCTPADFASTPALVQRNFQVDENVPHPI